MKKKIAAILSTILIFSMMAGCKNNDNNSNITDNSSTVSDVESTAAVDYEWSNVAIDGGGFVPGVIYNEKEEGLIYARTDIGGAYRYNHDQNRWLPLTDFLGSDDWNLIGIESIATDNVEPNRVYLACGTYSNSNGAIFSSDDYGENWIRFDLPFGCGANEAGRGTGERLMVDPTDNSTIYFGTRVNGLWKSTDYGENWAKVESYPVKGTYTQDSMNIGVMWVEIDPESGDIYTGVAETNGKTIYKSSDKGETWEALPVNMEGYYPLQADLSSNGKLYIVYNSNAGPNAAASSGAVYSYDTKEGKFEDITPEGTGDSFGFGGISVDKQNPDTLVVSTLFNWSPEDNIYRTTDGGKKWSEFYTDEQKNYELDITSTPWLDWGGEAKLGWWMTDIEIDPFNSDVLSYGTGATIFSTTNLTNLDKGDKVTVQTMADGIEETAVFKMISPPEGPQLYSIMGDLAGFRHDDVTEAPSDEYFFKQTNPSDIDCAWSNSDIVVRCGDHGNAVMPVLYSTDGAKTWNEIETLPAGYENVKEGSVAVSSDGSSFLWSGGSKQAKPQITTDLGKTWTECSDLPYNAKIAADRINPNKYYATADGIFYYSEDGGKTWIESDALVADKSTISTVGDTEGELWLCSGMLMHSTDGGKTFKAVKNMKADCIGFGKGENESDPMVLYVMGDDGTNGDGIYCSLDKGETWEKMNDSHHLFGNLTHSITGDSNIFGRVYFATNGRGIIMGDLKE